MSIVSTQKRFFRAVGRNAFFVTRRIISLLPYSVFRFFISIFIPIGRPLIRNKKRIAMENLQIAFGATKSKEEIKQIANQFFDNMATGMIELIYFLDRPKKIIEKVTIEGKEHLDAALSQGRGAVLLSAHFGSFILMYLRLALDGYKVNSIMRRMRDEEFEKYISHYRNNNGIRTIYAMPRKECVVDSLKCLRNNETLVILLDQNYGEDGRVFVDFFGQPAATAIGPVIFSQRADAPILPVFIIREKKDQYKIIIDPPVPLKAGSGSEEDLVQNISQLTKVIEGYVRRYPHEWGGWLHRRWKSKQA